MYKCFLFVCCIGLSTTVLALQVKSIKPNHSVTAIISAHHPTRLTVKGERIAILYGTPSAYTALNDNRYGQVYLMPTPAYQQHSFTLFVTTEKGNMYAVNVTPKPVLGQTIVLLPEHKKTSIQKHTHIALPNTLQLMRCIHTMVHHAQQESKKIHLGEARTITVHHYCLIKQLQQTIKVHDCHGRIYWVTNLSRHFITLQAHDFYYCGVRAIALQQHVLPARQSTYLYEVNQHG